MLLDRLDHLRVERRGLAGHAERAVLGIAARAPGDLREFVGREMPVAAAVELGQAGKRDVADVEIEAHADGVGRHEVIHVAVLIERDLGVARARAERAHHHGAPPFWRRSSSAMA